MIRLTELKLPLDHTPENLGALICKTLGIAPAEMAGWHIFKRSYDARKAALLVVYIVDVELASAALEQIVLHRQTSSQHLFATPDRVYRPVNQAPLKSLVRPVVVGFGPCGIFAALLLAQMGFKPIVLERGKQVRERTKDTWGLSPQRRDVLMI